MSDARTLFYRLHEESEALARHAIMAGNHGAGPGTEPRHARAMALVVARSYGRLYEIMSHLQAAGVVIDADVWAGQAEMRRELGEETP